MAIKFSIITPTNNPKFLDEAWHSIKAQSYEGDFEWVICPNGVVDGHHVEDIIKSMVVNRWNRDRRIRVVPLPEIKGVGAAKNLAFHEGRGQWLLELDHDDLLMPNCLSVLSEAIERNPESVFFHSAWADFEDGASSGQGLPTTYMTNKHAGWVANGFTFFDRSVSSNRWLNTPLEKRQGRYMCVRPFDVTAKSLSQIYWAPNHVRLWRADVYRRISGHNPDYKVCDDLELLQRTYHEGKMQAVHEPLYLYRVYGGNTWAQNVDKIRQSSDDLYTARVQSLIWRQGQQQGLPTIDLGGAFNAPPGWTTADFEGDVDVQADLNERWPWSDNSVFAFRASDFLEHLKSPMHAMKEVYRCLVPGGWLLSNTPSTDGRGAWQDPTHVSFWNENSFWYWTRSEQAKYIRNHEHRFQVSRLRTYFPGDFQEKNNIPYVRADLVALKPGYEGPGEKLI